jgi:hypothetical protein
VEKMVNLVKNTPHIPVVLASLLLWVSFAWGLPAEPPATEGEADAAPGDPWAGVRISEAYDYARCPRCGHKNEIRRPACYRCGYELPQPSAEMTGPDMVFVPGKGYYREGALVESGKISTPILITGLAIMGGGAALVAFGAPITGDGEPVGFVFFGIPGLCAMGVGVVLVIVATRTKPPVYALGSGERFEPYERPAFALRSADSDNAALKVEVTLLGF